VIQKLIDNKISLILFRALSIRVELLVLLLSSLPKNKISINCGQGTFRVSS